MKSNSQKAIGKFLFIDLENGKKQKLIQLLSAIIIICNQYFMIQHPGCKFQTYLPGQQIVPLLENP
jgi:hypothetical protein